MIALIPVIVAIVGLVMYLGLEGKPSEIGRILFWTSLLALMLNVSSSTIKLF